MHAETTETHQHRGIRRSAPFILGGMSAGHGVFHWFTQSFVVMLPEIEDAFNLNAVMVGGITSVREIVSGVIALPGGIFTDLARRHWGLVLATCMLLFGIGWLVMGVAPVYLVLLVGMGIVALSASMWHLPGVAALSHHFSHRRGSALSLHGVGGHIGDVAAPTVTGLLLGWLTWQNILTIYAAIPIFLTVVVFWAFRDIGRRDDGVEHVRPDLSGQMAQTKALFRQPRIWGIVLVAGLRGMAFISFLTFFVLYLNDEVGLSTASRGFYMSLLVLVGVFSTPAMGYLSDRVGRKGVLIPGMVFLCVVTLLLVPFGQGWTLLVLIALLGTFIFSDQPILTAAALDLVGEGPAATTLGVLSFSRFGMSAASPIIGGVLYGIEPHYIFYYIASLFALATLVLLIVPLSGAGHGAHGHGDGHGHGHGHEHDEGHGHGHEHDDGHGHPAH